MQKLPLNYNQLFWKLLYEVRFEVTVYRYGREKDWCKPWIHVGYLIADMECGIHGTESRILDCLGFPYMERNDQQTGEGSLLPFWDWWPEFAVILITPGKLWPVDVSDRSEYKASMFRLSASVAVKPPCQWSEIVYFHFYLLSGWFCGLVSFLIFVLNVVRAFVYPFSTTLFLSCFISMVIFKHS